MSVIAFLLFGLIVGLLARAFTPGRQKMGVLMTMLLGVAGSLLGGVIATLAFGHGHWDQPVAAGWIGSVIGSVLLLLLLSRRQRALF